MEHSDLVLDIDIDNLAVSRGSDAFRNLAELILAAGSLSPVPLSQWPGRSGV